MKEQISVDKEPGEGAYITLEEFKRLKRLDDTVKLYIKKLLKINNQAWVWSTDDLIRFLENLYK